MNEIEYRYFWHENPPPAYKITEIIDFKVIATSEPIVPWIKINSQDNG